MHYSKSSVNCIKSRKVDKLWQSTKQNVHQCLVKYRILATLGSKRQEDNQKHQKHLSDILFYITYTQRIRSRLDSLKCSYVRKNFFRTEVLRLCVRAIHYRFANISYVRAAHDDRIVGVVDECKGQSL